VPTLKIFVQFHFIVGGSARAGADAYAEVEQNKVDLRSPMKTTVLLALVIFGGGATIYAVLWLLASYTSLHGSTTLSLFIPLSLIWVAICIGWVVFRGKKESTRKNAVKETKR
jgi:hypothetical protein